MEPKNAGFRVPVIRVPALSVSPISGAKNGPNGENGGTVGISKGIHYTRKAGPVSAPVESPDEWQTIIRRCILSDKASLLAALTTMLERPNPTLPDDKESILDADFEHTMKVWNDEASKNSYAVDLSKNYICYGFHLVDAERVTIKQIADCLNSRLENIRGERLFFDSNYKSTSATIVIEVANTDGLEVRAASEDFDHRFAWRVSEALSGVEVISSWEDTAWIKGAVEQRSTNTWERGKAIWIQQQIAFCQNFLEMVKHISNFFRYDGPIRLRVLFSGLKGRSLRSPDPVVPYSRHYEAHQNTKLVDLTVKASALDSEARSSTIAAIIQPMNKLTQGPNVNAEVVVKHLARRG